MTLTAALEARRERITARVVAGEPITKVAKDEGISRQRVSQIVHKHGVRLDGRHSEREAAIGRRHRTEIRHRYTSGDPVRDIAEALGITAETVACHLRRLGYDRRRPRSAHGTRGRYSKHGCRCEPCRAANNAENRRYAKGSGREKVRAWQLAYHQQHPDRRRAWTAVHVAVARGDLVPPARCPCGRDARVGAHHDDYSRPLDVIWLCGVCHKARHQMLRKQQVAA